MDNYLCITKLNKLGPNEISLKFNLIEPYELNIIFMITTINIEIKKTNISEIETKIDSTRPTYIITELDLSKLLVRIKFKNIKEYKNSCWKVYELKHDFNMAQYYFYEENNMKPMF